MKVLIENAIKEEQNDQNLLKFVIDAICLNNPAYQNSLNETLLAKSLQKFGL